ncbi:hypothetical protein KGQ20_28955 [Catenulispora sp. NF23]|uniref:Secreted protein n=1 Tax=Catenulispora pinistramenti TaxID=2705254 RepID=A0ABS5KZR5_9ACTN|nr:hypothetical protein [Catenulispora pinistramenti]MBS2536799.1 hypothetical protein [Catenulispora pinistramenti]MBS2551551.1 hypothetical protein [Catenulispora pinistramenti]
MSIRRFRRVFAVGMTLIGAALLGAGPVAASGGPGGSSAGPGSGAERTTATSPTHKDAGAVAAPMAITLCHSYGTYLGLGLRRVAAGKNLLVVEVCGDPAKRTVSMVRDSYLKVDGPQASSLRFHWRWADSKGAVRGGGDDDNGAFVLGAQSENTFAWPYSQPVAPLAPAARCVVGVLTEGSTQFVTEPVCL